MSEAVFIRLLEVPVEQKGRTLQAEIEALNSANPGQSVYVRDIADLGAISGTPFAYWASNKLVGLFRENAVFENEERVARVGLSTSDDFRFLRVFWEIPPELMAVTRSETLCGERWVSFGKGGVFSPYASNMHVVVDWEEDGAHLKDYIKSRGDSPSRSIRSESRYFLPGLTWPLRASHFAPYALPRGSIFGVRGYAVLAPDHELPVLLAILNSTPFDYLFKLCLGRFEYPEFVVGVLQKLPWNEPDAQTAKALENKAILLHSLARQRLNTNEISREFCLPLFAGHSCSQSLEDAQMAFDAEAKQRQADATIAQTEIDEIVFELYGLDGADRKLILSETSAPHADSESVDDADLDGMNDEDETVNDLPLRVQELLQYCVGVAFGRWDIRMAMDPSLLPALQGPFDPLPRCAPAALVGTDGLPATADHIAGEPWLRARANVLDLPDPAAIPGAIITEREYPFPVAWHGILVDDPDHPADLIGRVRQVLRLLWGERSEAIEHEACAILGVPDLRTWFRDARQGFFAFHIKRYSRSRRKAPIYWLLQSPGRNYGIWLYCHRLRRDALYAAARTPYADAKVALEQGRLEELQRDLASLAGAERRTRQRAVERQQKVIADVTAFRDTLDKVALLDLIPDLNDGVLISMAPLHPLVPWHEPARMWKELSAGACTWSTMSQKMAAAGLVKKK